MQRNLRNTVAVLLVTVFTALAIFATVQLTARVTGIETVASAAATQTTVASDQYGTYQYTSGQTDSSQVMTCPRTGCSATSCHALQ